MSTTDGGYRLKLFLEQFHIRSAVLNAESPLLSRLSIIDQFNAGNFDYLIATDESTVAISKNKAEELGETDSNKKKQKKKIKDDHYGVSRGVDFQGMLSAFGLFSRIIGTTTEGIFLTFETAVLRSHFSMQASHLSSM